MDAGYTDLDYLYVFFRGFVTSLVSLYGGSFPEVIKKSYPLWQKLHTAKKKQESITAQPLTVIACR